MKKPELLAPAGDMNCLKAAARFGADAVYIGGPLLQLRAEKAAFTEENIDAAAKGVFPVTNQNFPVISVVYLSCNPDRNRIEFGIFYSECCKSFSEIYRFGKKTARAVNNNPYLYPIGSFLS